MKLPAPIPETILGFSTVESIGIAASILVLISFLMKEIRIIRTISVVACVVFVIYGLLLDALSIWILNGLLIFVHIFFLIRMKKGKGAVSKSASGRLQKFSRATFDKKALRETPWFLLSDVE